MKLILAFVLGLLVSKVCLGDENIVPNNSFENHTNIDHRPNAEDQFNLVDRWKKAGQTTPDWFSSREPAFLGYTFTGIQSIQPFSGTEYAGIAPFEGIEARLAHGLFPTSMDVGKFYKLTFWFCARNSSTQLRVHLREDEIPDDQLIGYGVNQDESIINSVPFIDQLSFNVDINTDPNAPGSFTPGTWYQFESGRQFSPSVSSPGMYILRFKIKDCSPWHTQKVIIFD